jgi:hypothetical protein
MKLLSKLVFAVVAASAVATSTKADTSLFFDFGSGAHTTPGNYNNIITTQPQSLSVTNAIDSAGAATNIDLKIASFAGPRSQLTDPGADTHGTTTPTGNAAIFDPEATRDSSYNYLGIPGPAEVIIEDLNPASVYQLTFFASRMDTTSSTYETSYLVDGQGGSTSVLLEPLNNVSNVAIVGGVSPYLASNGSGSTWTISVFLSPGPNNHNNAGQNWHLLGALRLVESVPEPSALASAFVAFVCVLGTRSCHFPLRT